MAAAKMLGGARTLAFGMGPQARPSSDSWHIPLHASRRHPFTPFRAGLVRPAAQAGRDRAALLQAR